MIRWPWCSRLALDCVLAENERLRQQNDRLTALVEKMADQLVRTERVSRGMAEVPRDQREQRGPEKMPPDIMEMLTKVGDSRIRAMQTREAYQRYARSGSWDGVRAEMVRANQPPGGPDWGDDADDE